MSYLDKEFVHFATKAVDILAQLVRMLIAQEVISHEGIVDKRLKDNVEIASVAKVQEAAATCTIGISVAFASNLLQQHTLTRDNLASLNNVRLFLTRHPWLEHRPLVFGFRFCQNRG